MPGKYELGSLRDKYPLTVTTKKLSEKNQSMGGQGGRGGKTGPSSLQAYVGMICIPTLCAQFSPILG